MVKFNTIGQIEHGEYPFEDAVIEADAINGAFGDVEDGVFSTSAAATKAIMQVEEGDDAGLDVYPIKSGSHVRVVDFSKLNGQAVEIYGAQLPSTYAVGDKLVSKADGTLQTGASDAPYFEIVEIIGNKLGVKANVVAVDTEE